MNLKKKLKEFKNYLNKITQYEQAANILQWDMQTCMPSNGGYTNTDVLTMLSSKSFELSVSDEIKDLLDSLINAEIFNNLDSISKKMILECKKQYDDNFMYFTEDGKLNTAFILDDVPFFSYDDIIIAQVLQIAIPIP